MRSAHDRVDRSRLLLAERRYRANRVFKSFSRINQSEGRDYGSPRQAEPLLQEIIESKRPPNPTALKGWLDANAPRPLLYEGMETAVVREGRARGD